MGVEKFETEYVKNNFKKWKEKYNIPDYEDFNLYTLFHLQEQFMQTPDEHVKTKYDLMKMINDIKARWHLKYLDKKEIEQENKFTLLIVTDFDDRYLRDIFADIIGNQVIRRIESHNIKEIMTNKYKIIFMKKSKDNFQFRGVRVNYFLNLTGDKEFEENVLKPMLKR